MKLIYLKNSLEISRESFGTDALAMWNILGANHKAFPDNTTLSLDSVKAIKHLGLEKAAHYRMNGGAI